MPKIPLFVWQDWEGLWSAMSLEETDDGELVGTGLTASRAVEQMKQYLRWVCDRDPYFGEDGYRDVRLVNVKTRIRPVYRDADRDYRAQSMVELTTQCVIAKRDDDLCTAIAPLLGVRFDYFADDAFDRLMQEALSARLIGRTYDEIAQLLPPPVADVKEVVVSAKRKSGGEQYQLPLPALTAVADPLGDRTMLRRFSRAYFRDEEVSDVTKRLTEEQASLLVVGDPGVGKSTVIADAVREAEREFKQRAKRGLDESGSPSTRRFWLTSGARLIAGMQYLGEWQARCEEVIHELASIRGTLCVENLLDLVRVGGREANESIASFLMPFIQQGELRVVSEATRDELNPCVGLLPGFSDLFQKMRLEPMPREKTIATLEKVVEAAKQSARFEIDDDVIEPVQRLFTRFLPYQTPPGPAAKFLRELTETAKREKWERIDKEKMRAAFVRQTGLPQLFLRDDLPLESRDVLTRFDASVIGQHAACEAVTHCIASLKAGLNDPKRPIGVLLFCGPTGVGKTELAKEVARFCFGGGADIETKDAPERLIRLDMSEFLLRGSADRLLQKDDGSPSELIAKIRQQPFCVVLFDEIEKAEPGVFDLLLNVFEEGRLADAYGRTTSFQSSILIMTSNLGAGRGESIGFNPETEIDYDHAVQEFFRPEFYNRIDEVVAFQPLSREVIGRITEKELGELNRREGLRERGIQLAWDAAVVNHLADRGFDPDLGARPLKRSIETAVVTAVSRHLSSKPTLRDCELRLVLLEGEVVVR